MPRRHREGAGTDRAAAMGRAAARRVVAGDARCLDLRAGAGGTESDRLRGALLPAGAASMTTFLLDGRAVDAHVGETILQVAQREGIAIPHLCHKDGLEPAGNCRACMVEVNGERVLAPSCCRTPQPGMQVSTRSERALKAQKMVLELLQSDLPEAQYTRH